MSDFIVSARKYRPATFDTVVGQAHITNTLKNAIKTNHLAQAFLFCGPRGVGKTTCARILAKTINCLNITDNVEACNECESCNSFNEGASHNVFELDAASNNSVDDIRSLIEQVRYAPQLGKYKVYIIDEVHMLSQSAFNAFLKTLEEPPKHAIFILATTEKHKILPTILSRCQIFDFNRIQIDDIAKHLAFIANNEQVKAEDEGLHIIAQKSDGALRDACSMFDQIVSFTGGNITYKAVIDNLNILDYDYYFKVTDALLEENISQALLLFNEITNNGFDGHNFIAGLSSHFRNLLVSKDVATLQLLEVSDSIKEKYKSQSAKSSLTFLVKGLTLFNKTDSAYKTSKNQRLQVELALIQLSSINAFKADVEKKKDIANPSAANPAKKDELPSKETAVNAVSSTVSSPNSDNKSDNTPQEATASQSIVEESKEAYKQASTPNQAPKNSLKRSALKTSTPSISAKLAKNEDDNINDQTQTQEQKVEYKFDLNELVTTWNSYAALKKEDGKINLATALTGKKPILKDNYHIEFEVSNKAIEEALNEDKANFLEYLRRTLNNYSIKLQLNLVAIDESKKLYSATDKYKHLANKNPAIDKLRKAFDLDIEF